MTKRPALIAKKTKTVRVSRTETYLVNLKYMGEEREFLGAMTDGEYALALNWYNAMCDKSEAREYLRDFLLSHDRNAEAKQLSLVSDVWIPTTACWIARMLNKGYEVPAHAIPFMEQRLKETLARVAKTEAPKEKNVVSIQERMRERQSEIIGDIEEMIDNGVFSLYDWLKSKEIPASYCPAIVAYYTPILDELLEALEGNDEQLKEGYAYLGKKGLRERVLFFSKLIEDAESYGNVTKKSRAPRKPRAVSVEKKLKHFRYQKEDNTFKIASIKPEKIIGAQELWTFNTKYKVVTVFRAIDRGGLQINRSSIVGYDEKTSMSKGTGRQAEIVLDKLQKSGRIVLKKMMEELKTDKPLQLRINENTILMKVI